MHSSKPFAFAAHVSAHLIIQILFLAVVPAASDAAAPSEPLRCECPANHCHLSTATDSPVAPPRPFLNCPRIPAPSSTTTEEPTIRQHHPGAALCGLGRCATMHSSKPFAFAAHVSAHLIIQILFLALVLAASDAAAPSEPLRCECPTNHCHLSTATDSPVAPPRPFLNCPRIPAPSSTTTEEPTIRQHHPGAALCGLGRCATMHSSKPFAFAAHVSAHLIIQILFLALVLAASDAAAPSEPLRCECPTNHCHLSTATDSPVAPPRPFLNCPRIPAPSSTTTEEPTIRQHHPGAALCGLGRCATRHSSKPFAFAAHVSAHLIIQILFLALVLAASDAAAPSEPLRCECPANHCHLSTATDSPVAPPRPFLNCPRIPAPSSTTTEEPTIRQHHPGAALCGLGRCATMHSSKPFAFAAHVSAHLIIQILFLAVVPAASDAAAPSEPLRCECPTNHCHLSTATDSPVAPPRPFLNCPRIPAPSSTTTEEPTIRQHHPGAALCGLGRCATMHSSKPFAFAAQVSAHLIIQILFLAVVPAASDAAAPSEPLRCECPTNHCHLSTATDSPVAPPRPFLNCPRIPAPSSTTTEEPTIRQHHPGAALCGLGRCATMHSSKPFAFAAHVSAHLIIQILFLAVVPAASDAAAPSEPLRCECPTNHCHLSTATDSPVAPPRPFLNCPRIPAPSSTTTEEPTIRQHHPGAALCGLGRCATMHSSKPFAFAAHVSAHLIIQILFLAVVPAASDAAAPSEPLRCECPTNHCHLSTATDSPVAPPRPFLNCPRIPAPSSTTTEEPTIRQHHPGAALCGLGRCATMHSSKPFAFAAHVSAHLIIQILFLAVVPAASDAAAPSEPLRCECPTNHCHLSTATDSPVAPPRPFLNCPRIPAPSSTTTEEPTIRQHHPGAALCGLGRCATMHSSKPFAFAAQVSAHLIIQILFLAVVPAASDSAAPSEPLRCECPANHCHLSTACPAGKLELPRRCSHLLPHLDLSLDVQDNSECIATGSNIKDQNPHKEDGQKRDYWFVSCHTKP
ncbi:uncharacterized protein [Dermacentor albipictus]|uniref:uncharacterized protein n=1 Tax=Dermacentor albipictus TaxID=60249 RepID=UPI0038FCAB5B